MCRSVILKCFCTQHLYIRYIISRHLNYAGVIIRTGQWFSVFTSTIELSHIEPKPKTFRCQMQNWCHKHLDQRFSTFFGPRTIFLKNYPLDHFYMLTRHEQQSKLYCAYVREHFIKDLWNSLWTTRNFRWTTGGPPGPR